MLKHVNFKDYQLPTFYSGDIISIYACQGAYDICGVHKEVFRNYYLTILGFYNKNYMKKSLKYPIIGTVILE